MERKNNKEKSATRVEGSIQEKTKSTSSPTTKRKWKNQYEEVALRGWSNAIVAGILLVLHAWFLFYLQEEWEAVPNKATAEKVTDHVELAIPAFLISMFIEIVWVKYKKSDVYRVNDSISNMATGSLMVVSKKILPRVVGFFPYAYVWKHFAVTQRFADGGPLGWWLMFFCVEFGYYWVHRTGHTVNAFWAMHGVHHSSEEYNLSVSLRQSLFHQSVSWAYYLPFALFFPPSLFILQSEFNLLYQFWIHTQVISKLGPLEWVLNTPSQHRVHHGKNPYCIDKNYGGTLCIFDRLFGTFQEEIDAIPIAYGNVHPINTFNVMEVNVKPWRHIFSQFFTLNSWADKFGTLFYGPGWIPSSHPPREYPIPPTSTDSVTKYDTQLPNILCGYLLVHFFVSVAVQTVGLGVVGSGPGPWPYLLAGFVFWTLVNLGGMSDRRWWAPWSELIRLALALPLSLAVVYGRLGQDGDPNIDLPFLLSKLVTVEWGGLIVFLFLSGALVVWHWADLVKPLAKEELGDTNYEKAEHEQNLQYKEANYYDPHNNNIKEKNN